MCLDKSKFPVEGAVEEGSEQIFQAAPTGGSTGFRHANFGHLLDASESFVLSLRHEGEFVAERRLRQFRAFT